MAKGSKKVQPRELVRLSPRQFSAAVALVVLLIGGAYLLGYHRAMRSEDVPIGSTVEGGSQAGQGRSDDSQSPLKSGSGFGRKPTMTFYSELTEVRPRGTTTPGAEKGKARRQRNQSEVDPAVRTAPKPSPVTPSLQGGGVMVQVGSYRTRERAEELLAGLTKDGFKGVVLEADLGPRGTWYRVRLGPYTGPREANEVLAVLDTKMSIKGFVVR